MARPGYYRLIRRYLSLLILKNKTVGQEIERNAKKYGETPFLEFEGEVLTHAEFNRRANRRAHLFRDAGVGNGDVVCLMMENRSEYLLILVALSKLGAVAAAINHNLRGKGLSNSIGISQGKKIIVGAECLEAYREILPQLENLSAADTFVDTCWEEDTGELEGALDLNVLVLGASDQNPPRVKLKSSALFMYIYTSGTTGMPKAARITHTRIFSAGLAMGDYALRARHDDAIYCALPLYHSNGILVAFGSALVGGSRLIISRRFSASKFWEDVSQSGATCFIYIGELLRYLMNTPPSPYDQKHRVTRILGNGLRPDIWEDFQHRFNIPVIREFYASTEGNAATINMDNVTGSMGTPVLAFANNMVVVRYDVESDEYLRDENGFCQICDPGEIGELLGKVKGTTPFHGYTNEADTEKKILREVLQKGDVYFRTGDLVKVDADGNFYFIDRIGDTYRWKGENVSTNEVAEILTGVPGVEFANVYGVAIPNTEGRAGMAALTLGKSNKLDPKGFFAYASEHLPTYAMPAFLRMLPEMDVTGTFKLKKTDLKMQGFNPDEISDALYYRDTAGKTYKPLDKKSFGAIGEGKIQF